MSEFTKTKIGFALALLAVLFTTSPLTAEIQSWGFLFFGFYLRVSHLYYIASVSLAFSVYFYSFQFLGEKPKRLVQTLADYSYAAAIIAPLLYFGLFLSKLLADAISPLIAAPSFKRSFQNILAIVTSAIAVYYTIRISLLFRLKEVESNAKMADVKAIGTLDRARELFVDGHFDLSVVEAFRAVEIVARKLLEQKKIQEHGQTPSDLIEALERSALLPKSKVRLLQMLRRHRNVAVHGAQRTERKDAILSLEAAQRIMASLVEHSN